MRFNDTIRLSTRMFRTRLLRTMLTILGVSVGIGTVVFLVSLGYGLQSILLERITTSESLLSLDVFSPEPELFGLSREKLEEFRNFSGVKEVVPVTIANAQLKVGDSVTDATANIVSPTFFRLSGMTTAAGKFFKEDDADKSVVISSIVAQLFNWTPGEAIGKQVHLELFYISNSEQVALPASEELVSVKHDMIVGGVIEDASPIVYLHPKNFSMIPDRYIVQAKVQVSSAENMEPVRAKIEENGFLVSALFDVVEQANKVFRALQITLAVFGATALLVSAIGMFNTMTIAFLERTQEIGIMRAIGASKRDIFWLFVFESGVMGFLGGVGGILIGFILQYVVNLGLNILAHSVGAASVSLFRTPFLFIFIIIIFSTTVGLITGIIPGRRASKLNPLHALKYK